MECYLREICVWHVLTFNTKPAIQELVAGRIFMVLSMQKLMFVPLYQLNNKYLRSNTFKRSPKPNSKMPTMMNWVSLWLWKAHGVDSDTLNHLLDPEIQVNSNQRGCVRGDINTCPEC